MWGIRNKTHPVEQNYNYHISLLLTKVISETLRKYCPRGWEMLKACVEAVARSAVSGYCVAFCLTWLLWLPQADLSLHESPGGLL